MFYNCSNWMFTDTQIWKLKILRSKVGHAVARHTAEAFTKNMWILIRLMMNYLTGHLTFLPAQYSIRLTDRLPDVLSRLPLSLRMEMEAVEIGLLLLASAGYDPRVAPGVYEKLSKVNGECPKVRYLLFSYPSRKERAEKLARAQIMEEALSIYRDVKAGRRVEGFL